jgi:DnaJ-class molecular chaperone
VIGGADQKASAFHSLGLRVEGTGTACAMAQNEDRTVETVGSMAPGDEAPPGTPGTGEDICPQCDSSGTVDGETCPNCDGTGRIVTGVGGA